MWGRRQGWVDDLQGSFTAESTDYPELSLDLHASFDADTATGYISLEGSDGSGGGTNGTIARWPPM